MNFKENALEIVEEVFNEQLEKAKDKNEEAEILFYSACKVYQIGTVEAYNASEKYCLRAANQNDNFEVKKIAYAYLADKFDKKELAKEFFLPLAWQDDDMQQKIEAMYYLATFVEEGRKREKYLEYIVNKDIDPFCTSRALYYLGEQMLENDELDKAQEYFYKAYNHNQNDNTQFKVRASYYLGILYLDKDQTEAEKYLQEAANQEIDEYIREKAASELKRLKISELYPKVIEQIEKVKNHTCNCKSSEEKTK